MSDMPKGENSTAKRAEVHFVLAHSYTVYFLGFILALVFDMMFPLRLSLASGAIYLGLGLVLGGALLVIWAQKSSQKLRTKREFTEKDFCSGPYAFSRNPTHLGLAIMLFGFGLIANSFFVILAAIISFSITKIFFLRKEEKILAARYGEPYLKYKAKVRF